MLVLERSRHQDLPYFSQFSMDHTTPDPFSSVNGDAVYSSFATYPPFSSAPHPLIDGAAFLMDAPPASEYKYLSHAPSAPPSLSTSQSSEQPSLRSSVSCASPASPSPSAIGSPYLDIASSLGPVPNDGYTHSYDMDPNPFQQEKLQGDFVGECVNVSSNFKSQVSPSSFSKSQSLDSVSVCPTKMDTPDRGLEATPTWCQGNIVAMTNLRSAPPSMSPPSKPSPMMGGRKCVSNPNRNGRAFSSPTPSSPASGSPILHSPVVSSRMGTSRKRSRTEANMSLGISKPGKKHMVPSQMIRSGTPSPPSLQVSGSSHNGSFQKSFFGQSSGNYVPPLHSSYPSLIQPQNAYPVSTSSYPVEPHFSFAPSLVPFPAVPAVPSPPSPLQHHQEHQHQHQHQHPRQHQHDTETSFSSPYIPEFPQQNLKRRNSTRSSASAVSRDQDTEEPQDGKEKGRCPHPDCGRVFKDLKAHMLTHQAERPEKCPIVTCEYHHKGFARKYDKNRHTLTHYKGTMVCGFCPGSGSAAEKSFNRADVFKRHLTSVHNVEQTAPNCRKKSPPASSNRKASSYSPDATGKCSTCSAMFNDAQEFYEHLDDCVLRVVQQEEPSEAINQQRLSEVASDKAVRETLERNRLVDAPIQTDPTEDENGDHKGNESLSNTNDRCGKGTIKTNSTSKSASAMPGGISKPRTAPLRRRNNRNNYPPSWGCPTNKMKMKKRTLCVYDGERRLWKDEMMLDNEFEVRVRLPGGDGTGREPYVTDLDVETLKRSEGVLSATEEERGPWTPGAGIQGLIGPAAVQAVGIHQDLDGGVDLDELMST